jgi:hypothetical protein
MTERKSLRRATCHIKRDFGSIKAKRGTFEEFIPVGIATAMPGEEGEILVLKQAVPYSEHEVLHAYNAAGYPEVSLCIKLSPKEFSIVVEKGYSEYLVRKLKGLLR